MYLLKNLKNRMVRVLFIDIFIFKEYYEEIIDIINFTDVFNQLGGGQD